MSLICSLIVSLLFFFLFSLKRKKRRASVIAAHPTGAWWKRNRGWNESGERTGICYSSLERGDGWLNIQFDIRWVFNSPDTHPKWGAAAVVLYDTLQPECMLWLNSERIFKNFQRHSTRRKKCHSDKMVDIIKLVHITHHGRREKKNKKIIPELDEIGGYVILK